MWYGVVKVAPSLVSSVLEVIFFYILLATVINGSKPQKTWPWKIFCKEAQESLSLALKQKNTSLIFAVLELCHLLQAPLQLQENRQNPIFFGFILQQTLLSSKRPTFQ
jgi:hypothetical protein